ncbi:hypothetical protein [Paenibacillus flagellatus]|uniref:hypothetical protein n=1 Tax=Paenibacillus flagellatus TaxID=2211139 RepID=UPI0011B4BCE1|nr:hypothetical protein [Paenibacillus flagellatus]
MDKDNGNDRDEQGSGIERSDVRASEGTYSARLYDAKASRAFGLESDKLDVEAGTSYTAFADVWVETGEAELVLNFYDGSGRLLDNAVTKAVYQDGWQTAQVSRVAPDGAVRAAVMLYSDKGNKGTSYWDRVRLTKDYTNLGVQVGSAAPLGAAFGIGDRQHEIYAVVTGNQNDRPIMEVIDVNTEKVTTSVTLPGASVNPTGAWAAATATDGTVYLGTYPNGRLYRYVPGESSISDLGQPLPGESYVFDLAVGADGKVYGGSYGRAGFFEYDLAQGASQIGGFPFYQPPGQTYRYLRALAHDRERGVSYLAMGANASILRYDHHTGRLDDILPAKYKSITLAGTVDYTGDRVFVAIGGYLMALRVDVAADGTVASTEEMSITNAAPRVSPAHDGSVYLVQKNKLSRYDLATKQVTNLDFDIPGRIQRYGWVTLNDQQNFPGQTLVAVSDGNYETNIIKYNPQNGHFRVSRAEGAPRIAGAINSIATGPDGHIYTSAYLYGGLGMYRPFEGDANDTQPETVYAPISQIDKMASAGGKLYVGTYPGGGLHEYDPKAPWRPGVNPKLLINSGLYKQDRPKAIAFGDRKVFMGTTGTTGYRPGALSVYDYATGAATVHENIVTDQSVIALAYHNGLLYGGTTIRGGYSSTPSQTEAKLFVYDPAAQAKVAEYGLPEIAGGRKLTAITELVVIDDRLWGMAEGYLFVFDPVSRTFDYFEEKFPDVKWPEGTYRDADLVTVEKDPDSVYGTIGNKYLFSINKADRSIEILRSDGADMLTADPDGNLYFKHNDTELWRYSF